MKFSRNESNKCVNCFIFWLHLLLLLTLLFDCQAGKPKFCGKSLNEVLDLVCIHGFVSRIKRRQYKPKKDIHNEIHDEQLLLLRLPIGQNCQNSVQGRTRHSFTEVKQVMKIPMQRQKYGRRKRQRRHPRRMGVVHECCRNGCLYMDIVDYCL